MSIPVKISDEYTGDVTPDPDHHGVSAQRRILDNATIIKTSVGPMDNTSIWSPTRPPDTPC